MSKAHRIEHLNDGHVVYIALDPDGVWARSEFPHPLITIDYDADGRVIGVSPAGPRIKATLNVYNEWLESGAHDTAMLVSKLEHFDDLILAPA
jgi:hypothetical protein